MHAPKSPGLTPSPDLRTGPGRTPSPRTSERAPDAEPEPEGDLREEAAAMTVAQLKHKLQTMGLAHLYAGKRGVKKADLVNMYVDGEEGGN